MTTAIEGTTGPAPSPEGISPVSAAGNTPDTPIGGEQPIRELQGDTPREPKPAEQPEQPESRTESKRLWQDLDSAERDYKALQAQYTRMTQGIKAMGINSMAELQGQVQLLQELSADPEFLKWAQDRLAAEEKAPDDETRKALELIDQISRQRAQEMTAPLYAQQVAQRTQQVFSQLDREFGPEWQQMKPKMAELLQRGQQAGIYSPQTEVAFDYDFVRGLYLQAVSSDPQAVARLHAKRLEEKRAAATTSTPGTPAGAVTQKPARSMAEAFAQAKMQLGV